MAESQATLSGLVPVEKVSQTFFRDGIFDARFTSSDYAIFSPTNEIRYIEKIFCF